MTQAVITATGLYTPPESIDNAALVASFNAWADAENVRFAEVIGRGEREPLAHSSEAFIVKASGIQSRYVMEANGILDPDRMRPYLPERPNERLSIQAEMGLAAAHQALDKAGITAGDIDLVIVACSNLQRPYPAVSVELQAALGAGGYAFDMNVACSSATFAIDMATNAIRAGSLDRVLIVNPEICSAHLNFRDRDSHFIFGDACTAIVLEADHLAREKEHFTVLGTRLTTQFSNAIRNNFGFLNRLAEAEGSLVDKLFVQEGRKVFKEVCPLVSRLILEHLDSQSLTGESVKRLWLHQANRHMNDLIAQRVLGREPTTVEAPVILDRYANTSSAGSIIALHLHREDMVEGDIGVVCSFGAGYSSGSVILRKGNAC